MSAKREVPGPPDTRFSLIGHVIETGSTNADLLAAAARGEPEGAVLVTDHQTAGRGRQARSWHDEPGNSMLMSVLLRPPPPVASLVPLIAGLAVTDGLDQLLGPVAPGGPVTPGGAVSLGPSRLALKWPNDVLVPELGERKLCGILAEATTAGGPVSGLVVVLGMGLNLRWSSPPPDEIAQRAATLEDVAGQTIDRWLVVAAVLTHLDGWLNRAIEDPATVLDRYRQRCITLGRNVRMQTAAGILEGRAAAIAETGGLVLDTVDGPVVITAGDAHHL